MPTYTGQEDQLMALGVNSDYYPLQLNTRKPFDYLTNADKYMTQQSGDFKLKFQAKLNNLMPAIKGPSWWNQDAKDSDDFRIDNTYWQKQEGNILLYEHYLLDDDRKVIESSWAPKHKAETAIQTNFRASRDPYTRIPKGVFYGWDLTNEQIQAIIDGETPTTDGDIAIGSIPIPDDKSGMWLDGNNLKSKIAGEKASEATIINKKDAQIIKSLRRIKMEYDHNMSSNSEWVYNDWFFVDFFHRNFLDNDQFQNSNFKKWIIDSNNQSPFDGQNNLDISKKIKELFDASTYRENEVKNNIGPRSTIPSNHHPIYEQQGGEIGAAPMFEGAMRDNQLYLFNIASQISNLANWGTPYGKQHYDSLPENVEKQNLNPNSFYHLARSKAEAQSIKKWISQNVSPTQYEELTKAFSNANEITNDLIMRMKKMKDYFKELGLNGKTFGMLTIAPGHGVSTIQTISKYSFIYKELGFSQPLPSNLYELSKGAEIFNKSWSSENSKNSFLDSNGKLVENAPKEVKNAIGEDSMFNMDDNGWFWNLGEYQKDNTGSSLSADKLSNFKGKFDFGIIAARDANYEAEVLQNSAIKSQVAQLFHNYTSPKEDDILANARRGISYDLWNEGLKTPFVMQMILDQIMTKAEEYAKANYQSDESIQNPDLFKSLKKNAAYWGDYFTKKFVS